MSGFLLDTNVPSELTRPQPDPVVERWLDQIDDSQVYLSVISLGELLKGVTALPLSKRRVELDVWINTDLRRWFAGRILPVTERVAERWGVLMGERQVQGRPVNAIDALIAATATEHGLAVATRNVKHFGGLGVSIFNPWDLTLH